MNRLGDVELDARGMRALAHPVRLAMLKALRAAGPSTATRLAPLVGTSPSVASWHLRHLAEHGLVQDDPGHGSGRARWWRAVGQGFRFEVDPDDPQAAVELSDALEVAEGGLVRDWVAGTRPLLEPQWLAVVSRRNTGLVLTSEELRELDDQIDQLIAPFANRDQGKAPAGARPVRLLLHLLPSADVPPA